MKVVWIHPNGDIDHPLTPSATHIDSKTMLVTNPLNTSEKYTFYVKIERETNNGEYVCICENITFRQSLKYCTLEYKNKLVFPNPLHRYMFFGPLVFCRRIGDELYSLSTNQFQKVWTLWMKHPEFRGFYRMNMIQNSENNTNIESRWFKACDCI